MLCWGFPAPGGKQEVPRGHSQVTSTAGERWLGGGVGTSDRLQPGFRRPALDGRAGSCTCWGAHGAAPCTERFPLRSYLMPLSCSPLALLGSGGPAPCKARRTWGFAWLQRGVAVCVGCWDEGPGADFHAFAPGGHRSPRRGGASAGFLVASCPPHGQKRAHTRMSFVVSGGTLNHHE